MSAESDDGQVLLTRGLTTAVGSSVVKPGSGATISLWTSSDNATARTAGTRFKRLICGMYVSHASIASGLQFDVSVDGSNWRNLVSYTIAATTLTISYVSVAAPFLRVRYVNDTNVLTTWEMWILGDRSERASQ